MDTFLPAFVMGFREGLEAFLIVGIILQYLRKSKNESLRKYVYYGTIGGIVAFIMVAREGVEVAIFTFAGQYGIAALFTGIAAALVLAVLINHPLVKVNLRILFNITLAYLILQAGFLLGYGIHEGLSALASMNLLSSENPLFIKAFDLSETIFYHKEGLLGLPLYVLFGWYSKPEILQFIMQYLYTGSLFYIWHRQINQEARKLNSYAQ